MLLTSVYYKLSESYFHHFLVLIAGTGWAGAQVLFSNIVAFWFGARGLEFDWKYIQMALDANVTLVNISIITCISTVLFCRCCYFLTA